MIGGAGNDFDRLHGGASGDRFLTDGDVVYDRSSQDAHIRRRRRLVFLAKRLALLTSFGSGMIRHPDSP